MYVYIFGNFVSKQIQSCCFLWWCSRDFKGIPEAFNRVIRWCCSPPKTTSFDDPIKENASLLTFKVGVCLFLFFTFYYLSRAMFAQFAYYVRRCELIRNAIKSSDASDAGCRLGDYFQLSSFTCFTILSYFVAYCSFRFTNCNISAKVQYALYIFSLNF